MVATWPTTCRPTACSARAPFGCSCGSWRRPCAPYTPRASCTETSSHRTSSSHTMWRLHAHPIPLKLHLKLVKLPHLFITLQYYPALSNLFSLVITYTLVSCLLVVIASFTQAPKTMLSSYY